MKKPSAFQYDLAMRAVKAMNVILLTVPFACCWYMAYADKIASPYYARGNYLVIAFYAILYFTYGRIYEAFLISMNPLSEMIYSQGLAALVSNAILYFVIWLLSKHLPNPLPLLGVFVVQFGLAAPILLITALDIKLTDGGSVFYKRCHLIKEGCAFQFYKFRSVCTDTEKDSIWLGA